MMKWFVPPIVVPIMCAILVGLVVLCRFYV